jgi:H/ACA ribonucleoprotein complex subunit 4
VRQATLKKKMMKEGLLDEKGKPNERTPSDWHSKYRELTHYGPASGTGTGAAETTSSSVAAGGDQQQADAAQQEIGAEKKKKKKDKKKRKEADEEDDE